MATVTASGAAVAAEAKPGPAASVADIARVHLGVNGAQADDEVFGAPSISADGSRVAFASAADNLVPGDTNDAVDVFVRDRSSGTTTRVSVSSAGREPLAPSHSPAISADGRWIAFTSYASNLSPGDLNAVAGSGVTGSGADVFLHDLVKHTTVRVSKPLVGWADGESDFPVISGDGRFVAFDSTSDNLVPGDTNNVGDVFLWDRQDSSVRRLSVNSAGQEGDGGSGLAAISADGSRVGFISSATNLVPGDTTGYTDAFVTDTDTGSGVIQRVSLATSGRAAEGDTESVTLSGDGQVAAFVTASPLSKADRNYITDVYTHDLRSHQTRLVSFGAAGNDIGQPPASYDPALSHDGRWIAFTSADGDPTTGRFTPWASQVWLRDMRIAKPRMVSMPATGSADDSSRGPAINTDGTHVAFASDAQNLVPFDDNNTSDAFVVDLDARG